MAIAMLWLAGCVGLPLHVQKLPSDALREPGGTELGRIVEQVNAGHNLSDVGALVLSLVAFIPLFKLRSYPIKLQNRIIRLEERLRLYVLAPAEWHAQIHRLTEDQLIGLRFAPDEEVMELAREALKENLSRKQIESRIKNWRADESRMKRA